MKRIEQLFNEPSDTGLGAAALRLLVGFDDVANHPETRRAHAAPERADTRRARASTRSSAQLTQMRTKTSASSGDRHRDQHDGDLVAQLNAAIKSEHDRRACRQRPHGPARPARQPARRAQRRNDPPGPSSIRSTCRSAAPRSCRTTTAGAHARHQRRSPSSALARQRARGHGHVGQGRRRAQRHQHDDSGLHREARHRRDDAARPGQLVARPDHRLDRDDGAGPERGGNAAVRRRARRRRVHHRPVTGADWSGAGGAAALQTALQTALNTAIGAATRPRPVTGGDGRALASASCRPGVHTLRCRRPARTPVRDAARHDRGRCRRHRRPPVLRRHRRSVTCALDRRRRQPGRRRRRRGRERPARRQHRARPGRSRDVARRRRRDLQPDDRAARRRHQDRRNRDDIQQQSTASLDNSRLAQSGVNTDEEMTNHGRVPARVRGLGAVHDARSTRCSTR